MTVLTFPMSVKYMALLHARLALHEVSCHDLYSVPHLSGWVRGTARCSPHSYHTSWPYPHWSPNRSPQCSISWQPATLEHVAWQRSCSEQEDQVKLPPLVQVMPVIHAIHPTTGSLHHWKPLSCVTIKPLFPSYLSEGSIKWRQVLCMWSLCPRVSVHTH